MAPTTCGRHRWTIKMHCEQESHQNLSLFFLSLSFYLFLSLSPFSLFREERQREREREIFIPPDGNVFPSNKIISRSGTLTLTYCWLTFLLTVHMSLRKRPMGFAASFRPVSSCFSLSGSFRIVAHCDLSGYLYFLRLDIFLSPPNVEANQSSAIFLGTFTRWNARSAIERAFMKAKTTMFSLFSSNFSVYNRSWTRHVGSRHRHVSNREVIVRK